MFLSAFPATFLLEIRRGEAIDQRWRRKVEGDNKEETKQINSLKYWTKPHMCVSGWILRVLAVDQMNQDVFRQGKDSSI